MWGMGGWTGSDDDESLQALQPFGRAGLQLLRYGLGLRRGPQRRAAWADLVRAYPDKQAVHRHQDPAEEPQVAQRAATLRWTTVSRRIISADIREKSLKNLGLDCVDLMQFHVWEDAWAER